MTLDLDRALDLLSSLRLESGQRWADVAADFQWATARWALDPAAPPYRWDSRPRGGSKTTDAAALCAVLMVAVLPPGSSLSAFAVDRDQARLLGDALRGFVARTAALRGVLDADAYAARTRSGVRLEILAADAASAWGRKDAFAVADEVTAWPTTTNTRRAVGGHLLGDRQGSRGEASRHHDERRPRQVDRWHLASRAHFAGLDCRRDARAAGMGLARLSRRTAGHAPGVVLPPSHLNEWCAPTNMLTSRDDVLARQKNHREVSGRHAG